MLNSNLFTTCKLISRKSSISTILLPVTTSAESSNKQYLMSCARFWTQGKPSFTPKKGKTSVVMFVGLQVIWNQILKLQFLKKFVKFLKQRNQIFVVAFDQAQAFKQSAAAGAGVVIVTKMAKCGGTLSADQNLLGGCSYGSTARSFCKMLSEGIFILGIMCEQFQNLLKWVPLARYFQCFLDLVEINAKRSRKGKPGED
ncbi:hypothetical protein OIU77_028382 [Salix suchowensis]|uniref:Uncharacterized protein n=1 Tax=Salix suchowensis TaxID=1278906 RepID=A0ABQ9BHN5_9ROSI|nr:hypothetical protein OIU77_028382 [Salix suchowensis]